MVKRSSKAKKEKYTCTLLGFVPVDSGQIMMVDPAYLRSWNHGVDYCVTGNLTSGESGGGQFMKMEKKENDPTFDGGGFRQEADALGFKKQGFFSVHSGTALGDGLYPVYAVEEDGELRALQIRFDENEWTGPTGQVPKNVITDAPEVVEAARESRREWLRMVQAAQAKKAAASPEAARVEPKGPQLVN